MRRKLIHYTSPDTGLVRCHFCSLYFEEGKAASGYPEAWVCPACRDVRRKAGYPVKACRDKKRKR